MKNTKPVIAMMYDFDKTLCTKNMQEYSFIPDMRLSPSEFWSKSNELAKKQKMDGILAYMWQMIIECKRNSKSIHRSDFVAQGKKMEFYKGVEDWFKRINEFGESQGVKIEHYIISSGLRDHRGLQHLQGIYRCICLRVSV